MNSFFSDFNEIFTELNSKANKNKLLFKFEYYRFTPSGYSGMAHFIESLYADTFIKEKKNKSDNNWGDVFTTELENVFKYLGYLIPGESDLGITLYAFTKKVIGVFQDLKDEKIVGYSFEYWKSKFGNCNEKVLEMLTGLYLEFIDFIFHNSMSVINAYSYSTYALFQSNKVTCKIYRNDIDYLEAYKTSIKMFFKNYSNYLDSVLKIQEPGECKEKNLKVVNSDLLGELMDYKAVVEIPLKLTP